MTILAGLLLLYGLCAVVPVGPASIDRRLLFLWWFPSWLGQSLALPLALFTFLPLVFARSSFGLGVAALALLLFAIVHWRNRKAGYVVLEAAGLRERIPLLAGLWPFANGPAVQRTSDLAYGPGARQRLDLVAGSTPEPQGNPRPILIHVPGGAWVTGKKNQQAKPLLHHLASRGWLCVDINYRLGPKHRFPAMVQDVLAAIDWARTNAVEHGGDPRRIVLTGGSAGGHLTALAALAHDDPSFKPGFADRDCSVQVAVPVYGRYDFLDRAGSLGRNHVPLIDGFLGGKVMPGVPDAHPELWRAASPIDRLRADAPPMLIIHGTADTLLPEQDAADFAQALSQISLQPVRYAALAGIQHAYDLLNSALTWAHVRALDSFLRGQLCVVDGGGETSWPSS